MAEMIAMLDGLGAYGENPIGTVDPRLLPSRILTSITPAQGNPVALGETPEEADMGRSSMSTMSKVLIGTGIAAVALWAFQGSTSPSAAVNGYPEPEMVKLGAPTRRRRKRGKKASK